MFITVKIKIPEGPTCQYPPEDGAVQGYLCPWRLRHSGSGQTWCRIFDEVDVTNKLKCAKCLKAMEEAAE